MYKNRLCVGPTSDFKGEILEKLHETRQGGHSGYFRTSYRIRQQFYWAGMTQQIKKFVAECRTCQQIKVPLEKPLGLLHSLNVPTAIWEEISVDFITGLPPVRGHSGSIVVVDRFSKYCHLGSLPKAYSAKTVTIFFMENILRLHGIPKKLVSHRDKVFLSKFWQELLQQSGTAIHMSSACHPQTDGPRVSIRRSKVT